MEVMGTISAGGFSRVALLAEQPAGRPAALPPAATPPRGQAPARPAAQPQQQRPQQGANTTPRG
jgi:biopolymer transport protein TolR